MREILCVPSHVLRGIDTDSGRLSEVLENGIWHEKDNAEHNDKLRQIIPYMVIMSEEGKVLAYPRSGSEERLHGHWSIGIGGHIEKEDGDFETGRLRELREELNLGPEKILAEEIIPGFIACHETEVDRVHLGVIYLLTVDRDSPQLTDEICEFNWMSTSDLSRMSLEGQLEEWSDIAYDRLAVKIARKASAHEMASNNR